VQVCDDLFSAKAERKTSTLAMLDFSQAFDSNHSLLLAVMKFYRFGPSVISWFGSYLENRTQRTKLGSVASSPLVKYHGVPQGSCLGPVLFILFAATMGETLKYCQLYAYADDAQLRLTYDATTPIDTVTRLLSSDLDSINEWSNNHGISLNSEKCSVMTFHSNRFLPTAPIDGVFLDGKQLKSVHVSKLLGVTLDSELTFSDHVSAVCQRAMVRLRILFKHRHLFPSETKLRLVQALVLSVIDYCLPVYGNAVSVGDMEKLQRVQNMCVRYVSGLRKFDHISKARKSLGLLPMKNVCALRTSCLVNKIILHGRPVYLKGKLKTRAEVRSRCTRQDAVLEVPRVRLEVDRKRFAYFAPKIFNALKSEMGHGPAGVSSFKKKAFNILSM
jgi:hypothetical protein